MLGIFDRSNLKIIILMVLIAFTGTAKADRPLSEMVLELFYASNDMQLPEPERVRLSKKYKDTVAWIAAILQLEPAQVLATMLEPNLTISRDPWDDAKSEALNLKIRQLIEQEGAKRKRVLEEVARDTQDKINRLNQIAEEQRAYYEKEKNTLSKGFVRWAMLGFGSLAISWIPFLAFDHAPQIGGANSAALLAAGLFTGGIFSLKKWHGSHVGLIANNGDKIIDSRVHKEKLERAIEAGRQDYKILSGRVISEHEFSGCLRTMSQIP